MQDVPPPDMHSDSSHSYPGLCPSCRAEALAYSSESAECLITPETRCPHRHSFGSHFLCYHPNLKAIVEATNKAGK